MSIQVKNAKSITLGGQQVKQIKDTNGNILWKKGHQKWYLYSDWWNYCSDGLEGQATEEDIGQLVNLTVNGQVHQVRLIGIDHDDLATGTGKAHCTFEFFNLLSDSDGYSIATVWNWENGSSSTNYDFLNSNLRKALDGGGSATLSWYQKGSTTKSTIYTGTVLSMLPESLRNVLKEVTKQVATTSSYTVNTYNTKLFVLSYREMTASGTSSYAKEEGSAYAFYTGSGDTDANRIKHQPKWHDGAVTSSTTITDGKYSASNYAGYNSSTENYGGSSWLRSPSTYDSNYAWYVRYVGYLDGYYVVYFYAFAVAPAFCI